MLVRWIRPPGSAAGIDRGCHSEQLSPSDRGLTRLLCPLAVLVPGFGDRPLGSCCQPSPRTIGDRPVVAVAFVVALDRVFGVFVSRGVATPGCGSTRPPCSLPPCGDRPYYYEAFELRPRIPRVRGSIRPEIAHRYPERPGMVPLPVWSGGS